MIRGGLYCLSEAYRLCATASADQCDSADRQQTHRRRFGDGRYVDVVKSRHRSVTDVVHEDRIHGKYDPVGILA